MVNTHFVFPLVLAENTLNSTVWRLWTAETNAKVEFGNLTILDLVVENPKSLRVFCRYDQTAGVAVNAVAKRGRKSVFLPGAPLTLLIKVGKQMVDQGMDMHTSLVYLAQWLGHRSTQACEYYLRYATTLFPYLCSKLDDTLEHALKALGDSLEVPDEVD